MLLLLTSLLLALSPGCNRSDDGDGPGATVPEESTTTTTAAEVPTTVDPASYAVPDVIDQAYVQRVVSAYDHVLGDAIRVLKRDGNLSDDFLKHLLAIYSPDEFDFQQKLWRESLAAGRLSQTPERPGDPLTSIANVVRATPDCVIARAERDLSANFLGQQAESPQDDYIVLVPRVPDRDPLQLNATPWVMSFDGFNQDNSVPVEKCG